MYRRTPISWKKHLDFMLFDLIYLQIAFVLAYFLRQNEINVYQNNQYRVIAVVIGLFHICYSIFAESYKSILYRGYLKEFLATVKHVFWILICNIAILFFSKTSEEISRLTIIYFAIISIVMLYCWHCIWKRVLLQKYLNFRSKQNLLLISEVERSKEFLKNLSEKAFFDFAIIGIILTDDTDYREKEIHGIPVVGNLDTVEDYLKKNVVDEVLFTRQNNVDLPQDLVEKCEIMGLTVHVELPIKNTMSCTAVVEQFAGTVVLSSYTKLVTESQMLIKRCVDIVGSVIGLMLTGIISVLVVPAIYFSDHGPVIFTQNRVGKNGRTFKLYKFRSMYQDAEERKKEFTVQNQISGPMFKLESDPRIIGSGKDGKKKGIGWLIRTTSIDELPQFWNVLKGDMSLVGTRPPTLDEWEQYEIHHRARMAIKPGITGMWQVSGRSNILDFDEVVRLDTEYIKNWSLSLDIKILVKTVFVIFSREGSR